MLKLSCAVQNYEWGKKGEESEVAKLLKFSDPNFEVKEIPYAELWIGTHSSGPSTICGGEHSGKSLAEWLELNVESLGPKVLDKFGNQLPFLFKVLSVNKALSIQAHPNKSHAEKLHKEKPHLYKDPNHKPEMAIALSTFEALCGFRTVPEIVTFLNDIPELKRVIGNANAVQLENSSEEGCKDALKNCLKSLMTCSDETVKASLDKLAERYSTDVRTGDDKDLFLRLYKSYPGDVGCFGIFLFNYIQLQPGEAIFLGPNEPHAYLYGDCIECMACSDNVVRAGLTPKHKDVSTLCEMLTYNCSPAEATLFQGNKEDLYFTLFSPPVPDFCIFKLEIPAGVNHYVLKPFESASIILVVSGEVDVSLNSTKHNLRRGSTFFISASQSLEFAIGSQGLLLFGAAANVRQF